MREELRKKLWDNRARLVSELDVSAWFLASLLSGGVIKEEHKYEIQARATNHSKVDKLIDILGRRPDDVFQLFCDAIKHENPDLFYLLTESKEVAASSQQPEPKQMYHADEEDYPTKLAKQTGADIEKYLEGFEKVLDKLEVYIDPLNELPSCFVKHKIITRDEADKIDCTKSHAAREIVAKMRECLNSNHLKILHIADALIDNDQEHIANFIKSSGENTDSPDSCADEEELGAIDRNMFCLKKLVNIGNDYLDLLVEKKCITANHKKWIMNFRKENKDVDELFEILKRRSLTHFSDYIRCLEETGHLSIIDDILRTGGVAEITCHLRGIENQSNLEAIEQGILGQFRDYVDGKTETKLDAEQKLLIDKFLNKDKKRNKFVDIFLTNSLSLYFQYATNFLHEWLTKFLRTEN